MEMNKVYNMDCIKGMQEISSETVNAVITDPPYGIEYKSDQFDKIENDTKPFIWFLQEAFRILRDDGVLLCFCRWNVQPIFLMAIECAGFTIKSEIIWDRVHRSAGDTKTCFAPRHDNIIFAIKKDFEFKDFRPVDVLNFEKVSSDKLTHPNEKPMELMRYLISSVTSIHDLVVDPFSGSGSTLLACKHLDRNFIGFDIDESFVDMASKRLNQSILKDYLGEEE